jgi:formate dehydrogenase iron-sulfur subunit
MAKAFLIDTTKCIGCRACQIACKRWNELPAEKTTFTGSYQTMEDTTADTFTLIKFKEVSNGSPLQWLFRKKQCMQCSDPACIKVCPTQAIIKHKDGFKIRDAEKCVGCGMCVSACPFGVPKKDEKAMKVRDCVFCGNRVVNNLIPSCAKTCPPGALSFGEREEIIASARARVASLKKKFPKAYLYGETELGGLGVMTIITESPAVYDLPENPKVAEHFQALDDFYRLVGIKNETRDAIVKLVARWSDEHGVKRNPTA